MDHFLNCRLDDLEVVRSDGDADMFGGGVEVEESLEGIGRAEERAGVVFDGEAHLGSGGQFDLRFEILEERAHGGGEAFGRGIDVLRFAHHHAAAGFADEVGELGEALGGGPDCHPEWSTQRPGGMLPAGCGSSRAAHRHGTSRRAQRHRRPTVGGIESSSCLFHWPVGDMGLIIFRRWMGYIPIMKAHSSSSSSMRASVAARVFDRGRQLLHHRNPQQADHGFIGECLKLDGLDRTVAAEIDLV